MLFTEDTFLLLQETIGSHKVIYMGKKRIVVAGGVVVDTQNRVLLLERDVVRNNKYTHEVRLPKGHVDTGESHEKCARREVGEESGYWDTEIIADLGYDLSEFEYKGKNIIRTEHYFLMRADPDKKGNPTPVGEEETLFRPIWVPIDTAETMMTYPSERHFIRRAKEWLKGQSDKSDLSNPLN